MRKLTSAVCGFCALAGLGAHAEFYATGGEVTLDGEYYVHTFTNASDTLTVRGSGEVEVLLVGGGGGGGAYGGGGGGGGQVVSTTVDLTTGDYPIVVGAGGAGAVASTENITSQASNGCDTIAFDLTAKGGGAGGSKRVGYSGANGGGGGTGPYENNISATRINVGGEGQDGGNAGGASLQPEGYTHFKQAGGGGGGAGGPGADARLVNDAIVAGDGGCGVTNAIAGCALGYGGGGGGGRSQGTTGEGSDGGGNGGIGQSSSNVTSGKAGVDGRGGGGGGGGRAVRVAANGGKGGCGAVIVRYKPTWPDRFEKIEVTGNYSYRRRRIDGVQYGLYTFTNDVSVKITGHSYADLLLVGGGGGGGRCRAGGSGGGGGGVVETNRLEILGRPEPYMITIGEGGAGGTPSDTHACNGGDTSAFGLTAHGGGAGGCCEQTGTTAASCAGKNGASGGGGAPRSTAQAYENVRGGKAIWPGEGFDGGCATNQGTNKCWGGGGGGAGGVGGNGYTTTGTTGYAGAGGVGRVSLITGLCYGGGGGGGQCCFSYAGEGKAGAGGEGGGGNGSGNARESEDGAKDRSRSGCNGVDGFGGGGGGAGMYPNDTNPASGGTGGCGTVILRVREEERGLLLLFR